MALVLVYSTATAQSYEFRQGYIFDQRYVKRISVSEAEKATNVRGLFDPLLTFDWIKAKEDIKDPRVKRSGNRLVFTFGANASLSLKDFSTKKGDGESQLFKYLQSIPGYHLVGVEYGHDQPQFMMISETGSPIYFVNTN